MRSFCVMDTPAGEALEIDLHRLELRFAEARLIEPRAVEVLARSIEECGQLIVCIAVPEGGSNRMVLIDGYRRILALRRLGRDTACVESWACDLAQALLRVLARANSRPFAALEEALLLRELVYGQGLSEREVARRTGRDVSWVSRRLPIDFGVSWLSRLISTFSKRYPDVRLAVDVNDRWVDVATEPYDVAIHISGASNLQLPSRRVATLNRGLYASPEYLARKGVPTGIEELRLALTGQKRMAVE